MFTCRMFAVGPGGSVQVMLPLKEPPTGEVITGGGSIGPMVTPSDMSPGWRRKKRLYGSVGWAPSARFMKMKLLPSSRGKPANESELEVPAQELKLVVPVPQLLGL